MPARGLDMSGGENVPLLVAFGAGIISFLSPCVLPLIPSYLSFITGLTLEDMTAKTQVRRGLIIIHSLFFVAGFSLVFVLMGASITAAGSALAANRDIITRVGGVIIILMGIHLTGLVRLSFLDRVKLVQLKHKPVGFIGTGVVGIVFAAGWTPCIGPILASILIYASTSSRLETGILLLSVYSLGLGIPFLLTACAVHRFFQFYSRFRRYLRVISIFSGIFLIFAGVLIFTNYLGLLTGYLNAWLLPIFPFLAP
ncbi:MAG: cytochrome c biogenesis protein CcdA [Thermodesulfobacteriota bacterium]